MKHCFFSFLSAVTLYFHIDLAYVSVTNTFGKFCALNKLSLNIFVQAFTPYWSNYPVLRQVSYLNTHKGSLTSSFQLVPYFRCWKYVTNHRGGLQSRFESQSLSITSLRELTRLREPIRCSAS